MAAIQGLQQRIAAIVGCKQIADTSFGKGAKCFKQDDFANALIVFQQGLRGVEKVLGRYDEKVATLHYNIASCLIRLKRFEEAMPYLQECITVRAKLFGDKDTQTEKAVEKLKALESSISEALKK